MQILFIETMRLSGRQKYLDQHESKMFLFTFQDSIAICEWRWLIKCDLAKGRCSVRYNLLIAISRCHITRDCGHIQPTTHALYKAINSHKSTINDARLLKFPISLSVKNTLLNAIQTMYIKHEKILLRRVFNKKTSLY